MTAMNAFPSLRIQLWRTKLLYELLDGFSAQMQDDY